MGSMYYEKLKTKTGRKQVIFPNFNVFVSEALILSRRTKLNLVGHTSSIELYPFGRFFCVQDQPENNGMLLQLDSGIFYEFIPADQFLMHFHRVLDVRSSSRGQLCDHHFHECSLWGYNIGDTVMFTSTSPYRIVVSGRINISFLLLGTCYRKG